MHQGYHNHPWYDSESIWMFNVFIICWFLFRLKLKFKIVRSNIILNFNLAHPKRSNLWRFKSNLKLCVITFTLYNWSTYSNPAIVKIKAMQVWSLISLHERHMNCAKVIIEKSRGEVSLMEQDTIENVS